MRQRFLRLTAINILANVTVPLAGLVDAAMLGHLPDIRFLAGVALGGVVFDLLYWSFGFLRMSATGLTAQAMGAGDSAAAERILQRVLLLALLSGGLILLLRGVIADLGFALLAGEPQVEAAAQTYFAARIWGAPAVLANLAFIGWFLGREEPRLVLAMTLVASLGNIALDYLFILRLDLAAQGAGLATMLSQYAMFALALAFYRRRRGAAPWSWPEILQPGQWASLLRLQQDIFIRTLLIVGSFAAFTAASALFGTVVLAANNLLIRLLTLASLLIDGVAYATETLAGRLFGAGDVAALRRLLRLAFGVSLTFAALYAIPTLLVPGTILGWLTDHQPVVAAGARLAPWLVATLLIGASAYVLDGVFLALAAGRQLRNSMLISSLAVFAPIAAVAVWQHQVHILWLAMIALMLARVVTLAAALPGVLRQAPSPQSALEATL